MAELGEFGLIILVVSTGVMLALVAAKISERFPIPAPALFLLVALAIPVAIPHIETVERIGVVALIVILFDGGMHIGWRRFRRAIVPIAVLGVVGTLTTAVLIAICAHFLLDFSWTLSGVVAAALAPTDPAVMFSILGDKEIGGHSGTILEGEAGVNDPVGIALMIGMLEYATSDHGSSFSVVKEFTLEMTIGLAVGPRGSGAARLLHAPHAAPERGAVPAAHARRGRDHLRARVRGPRVRVPRGLHRRPRARASSTSPTSGRSERFHTALASLGEIVVFVVLGLTVNVGQLFDDRVWLDGLLLAVALAFVARPLGLAPLLAPMQLRLGEKVFIAWSGLKGAVPILLAALALLADVDDARRIYEIVFVVVLFSVVVQGASVPFAASRLGVPMRVVDR